MMAFIQHGGYLMATVLFISGLKQLSSPATARRGNVISACGMLIGVIVTLVQQNIIGYQEIVIGMVIGAMLGVAAARLIKMTAMPEMVAVLNGCGGGSSLLLAFGAYIESPYLGSVGAMITVLSMVIGGITCAGSMIAWGKLAEKLPGRPIQWVGQKMMMTALWGGIGICTWIFIQNPIAATQSIYIIIGISLVIGVVSVISIGGGDMPVVIALLNSYSGIAASAAGFVIGNVLLIIAGLLVGASGLILTNIMCKAMNRSLRNVLFGGFGAINASTLAESEKRDVNPIVAEDAYLMLEAARKIIIVPGYGMAVAQAQHSVRELSDILESNGCEVTYAIHPVAGRMPGHMNVLLAEASVPYEQLAEMDEVNPQISQADVCMVIGANDVVNPDALENKNSPIYGMPIIQVSKARTVFVLKRSMNPGFAGIQNPLFFRENTRMLFGDAKESLHQIIAEFKE